MPLNVSGDGMQSIEIRMKNSFIQN